MINYSYTFEIRLSDGRLVRKEISGRSLDGRDKAAWDFARRQYRDPHLVVLRLVATDDPRVSAHAE